MKTINGHTYSRTSFEDYKLRLKVEFILKDGSDTNMDIYTTQTDVDVAKEDLLSTITEKVDTIKIVHAATKEQDDAASSLIDEWLKEPVSEQNATVLIENIKSVTSDN